MALSSFLAQPGVRPQRKRRLATGLRIASNIPAHIVQAQQLDRAADHHLRLGFHGQAERLAHLAAELRGVAP